MSAIIYMAVMSLGVILFVGVPLYLASRPAEIKQSTATWAHVVNREKRVHAATRAFPVAKLSRERIIDAATVATLAAKTERKVDQRDSSRARADNGRGRALGRTRVRNRHSRSRNSYAERTPRGQRAGYPNFAAIF